MATLFGSNPTVTKNSLSLKENVLSLSEPALQVLQHVAEHLEEAELSLAQLDDRGVYTEYDSFDCKPFTTKGFNELVSSGLVSVHPDSEQGVAFLSMNRDVFNVLVNTGNFTFSDDL